MLETISPLIPKQRTSKVQTMEMEMEEEQLTEQKQRACAGPRSLRYMDALYDRTREIELSESQSPKPLRAFLSVDIPERFSPSDASSLCAVTLNLPTYDQTANVAKLLSALATVLRHLQLLNVFPAKKASFWRAVFTSQMAMSVPSRAEAQDWMLENELFPSKVVLKVSGHKEAINESLLKQIGAFFSAKPDRKFRELLKKFPIQTAHVRDYRTSVGLAFTEVELKAGQLKMLQQVVLDHVYRSPSRGDQMHTLDMLVLSHNDLDAGALHAVADILMKNDIYELKRVELCNITGREENLSSEVSLALTAVIQASFGEHGAVVSRNIPRERTQSRQLELVLSDNYLRVEHYAALFSALRYDETIKELGLAGTMSSDMDVLEREQCWRWIAFGLFYRRSRMSGGIQAEPRKIDLSLSSFTIADADAFEQALRDPVELLDYGGGSDLMRRRRSSANTLAAGATTVRGIMEGAIIHRDYELASELLLTVQESTQLECLWVDSDRICVVVPGVGLGWIEAEDQFVRVDYEESPAPLYERLPEIALVMNSVSWPDSSPLCSIIRCTGLQLVSLDLEHNSCMTDVVAMILRSCDKLQQLNLEGWITSFSDSSMYEPEFFELMHALHGDFGRRLLSLDLSGNRVGNAMVAVLAASMSSPNTIPALQHLRLCRSWMSEAGFSSLINALDVNKTVVCLELSKPHGLSQPGPILPQPMHLESARLSDKFDGELVRSEPLPLKRKLAFLSTIANPVDDESVRTSLDRWMLTSIFEFAGREIRRRIIWR